jgi:hypothetical protein
MLYAYTHGTVFNVYILDYTNYFPTLDTMLCCQCVQRFKINMDYS